MNEVFPLVAGLVVGLLVQKVRTTWLKVVTLVILCMLFGVIASYISGELAVSWGFLSVDATIVWLGAALSIVLIAGWRRWSKLSTSR
jgi:hypothetical protein